MYISVSDYDLMAQDVDYLIHNGVDIQPAVDTIAAENKLTHAQRNSLGLFMTDRSNRIID